MPAATLSAPAARAASATKTAPDRRPASPTGSRRSGPPRPGRRRAAPPRQAAAIRDGAARKAVPIRASGSTKSRVPMLDGSNGQEPPERLVEVVRPAGRDDGPGAVPGHDQDQPGRDHHGRDNARPRREGQPPPAGREGEEQRARGQRGEADRRMRQDPRPGQRADQQRVPHARRAHEHGHAPEGEEQQHQAPARASRRRPRSPRSPAWPRR